jgi:ABC-type transport system substrate-binding protein
LGGNNLTTYCNSEVDELCEEGVRTMDKQIRIEIFRKIHRILYDEQPYTFLVEPLCDLMGVNSRIHVMNSESTGKPYFNYGMNAVQYWWIEKSAESQKESPAR